MAIRLPALVEVTCDGDPPQPACEQWVTVTVDGAGLDRVIADLEALDWTATAERQLCPACKARERNHGE